MKDEVQPISQFLLKSWSKDVEVRNKAILTKTKYHEHVSGAPGYSKNELKNTTPG